MEAAGYRSRAVAEVDRRSEWLHGDDFDTLIVDVSGFTRDQLKVQVEPSGSLKISGERALNGGRQWCHFLKRFDLSGVFDAAAIKVQLDKGVLYIQVPRSTDDSQEDAPREEEDTGLSWSGGHTAAWRAVEQRAWRLATSLGKHRYVVLNVVLAVVLLWLVAFANSKQSGGLIKNE
ncbi:18.1 kDa class I heat shock protein-like [Aegilops tauschii subsp. strangulata]|uniref:18.1 kDa class I heat shock protein-like n=1 Tax=Aegilops tauschii subsp. strangulata TaxID=200361 RepID=UPI00098BA159|nr:22.0 kDa heat shock protein-like [Aegilops tauschii subsp. strangulata]